MTSPDQRHKQRLTAICERSLNAGYRIRIDHEYNGRKWPYCVFTGWKSSRAAPDYCVETFEHLEAIVTKLEKEAGPLY